MFDLYQDLNKVVWLYVLDGYKRSWKTLWLIREPNLRRVFIGHINTIHKGYEGTNIELVDPNWRMRQKPYIAIQKQRIGDTKLARPYLYQLEEV